MCCSRDFQPFWVQNLNFRYCQVPVMQDDDDDNNNVHNDENGYNDDDDNGNVYDGNAMVDVS